MDKRLLNSITVLLLMAGSVIYGFFIHRNQLFPYAQVRQLAETFRSGRDESQLEEFQGNQPSDEEETLTASEKALFEEIDPLYAQTNVANLLSIQTPADVDALRQQLVTLLWGEGQLPQRLPDVVQQDVGNGELTKVARVERLVIKMEFGLDSVAYHYIPTNSNGKLIIWHEGHYHFIHTEYVQQFIDQGYAVLTFCMPLYCENSTPVVSDQRLGDFKLAFHDHMVFLSPETGHPVKYFLEPIIASLNYLEQEYEYRHIAMAGFSGGGWSTTMVAAIDPRVQSSFPAAGSYPVFLRGYRDRSHYEQQLPEIYTLTNFLELYVMGGYGDDRMQMQIINQYDPCCYAGIKGQVYADEVAGRVAQLGSGSWELYIDPYYEHGISPQSMELILDYLADK